MADAVPQEPADKPQKPAAAPPSLDTRLAWIEDWMTSTADARNESARDEQYYYGKQWTNAEIAELNKRKQPVIVDNLIRRKVNAVRGEEIAKRVDPEARPRTPKHEDEAHAITDALRYVEEDQSIDELGGDAMLDALNAGVFGGIVEVDEEDGYRCTVQSIPWTQLAIDPRSRRRDGSDAKWKANIQWMDLDDAEDIYPDAKEALAAGCAQHIGSDDDTTEDRPKKWFDAKRKRVKVCEMYYRSGKDWYRCDFTQGADLRECAPSVYLDPRSKDPRPWCPLLIYRVYVDDENMAHGVVRDMISPQDEVNKRKSKYLHIINTKQVIYEEGSVEDIQAFQTAIATPDGAAKVNAGALNPASGAPQIQINTGADMGPGQVQLLQEAKQAIDAIGPAAANLPDMPQSASGRAFLARQKSANRELGPVFEIFSKFRLDIYWHVWGCIKQFWTDELWLRVTDEEETAGYRWVGLNRRMSRGERLQELLQKGVPLPNALQAAAGEDGAGVLQRVQQMHQAMSEQAIAFGQPPPGGEQHMLMMVLRDPAMQVEIIENQVAEAMMDITIHEAPESAVLEDEEFSKLAELAGMVVPQKPEMAPLLTKMLIQLSAFRNKREVLKEMDKPPDPQQAQMQQQQQQLQMAGVKAGIDVQTTQAQLNAARAAAEQAKVQISGAEVPSKIERNKASAMHSAALAGEKAGGGMPFGGM